MPDNKPKVAHPSTHLAGGADAMAVDAAAREQERQRELAKAEVAADREAAEHPPVPGGAYIVGGVKVDANGVPLADKKPE